MTGAELHSIKNGSQFHLRAAIVPAPAGAEIHSRLSAEKKP